MNWKRIRMVVHGRRIRRSMQECFISIALVDSVEGGQRSIMQKRYNVVEYPSVHVLDKFYKPFIKYGCANRNYVFEPVVRQGGFSYTKIVEDFARSFSYLFIDYPFMLCVRPDACRYIHHFLCQIIEKYKIVLEPLIRIVDILKDAIDKDSYICIVSLKRNKPIL